MKNSNTWKAFYNYFPQAIAEFEKDSEQYSDKLQLVWELHGPSQKYRLGIVSNGNWLRGSFKNPHIEKPQKGYDICVGLTEEIKQQLDRCVEVSSRCKPATIADRVNIHLHHFLEDDGGPILVDLLAPGLTFASRFQQEVEEMEL